MSLVRGIIFSARGAQDVLHRVEERVSDLVALALTPVVDLTDIRSSGDEEAVPLSYEVALVEQPVDVGSGDRVIAIVPDAKALDEP